MRHWLVALEFVWLNHRTDVIGLLACTAVAIGLCSFELAISRPDLSLKPAVSTPTEGTIIGFVGGDSKYSTGVSAYIRTRDNSYGLVWLPFNSGCRNGDRITIDEWQVNGRTVFRARPPGCTRAPAGGV
jgi:hypothetical protein